MPKQYRRTPSVNITGVFRHVPKTYSKEKTYDPVYFSPAYDIIKVMKKKRKTLKKSTKPHFRQSLFWDVEAKNIDTQKHAVYIIERILDFGNDNEVRWMLETYSKQMVRKIVKTSRVLHAQTRPLWLALTKAD